MLDLVVEPLGEAAEAVAEAVVETVGESVVEIVGMAADAVLPDRTESSEEHESSESESNSEE